MANNKPIDDFDWDAFVNQASSQSIEKSTEETTVMDEETVVFGTVISINQHDVLVNIGSSNDGIVSASEFLYNPELKVGDVVENPERTDPVRQS